MRKKKGADRMKKTISVILILLSIGFFIVGISYCRQGFDKKDNYYLSEYSWGRDRNAYVGGDAYNYIINGTYFAGYCALGGAMFVCGSICGAGGLKLLCQTYNNTENSDTPKQTNITANAEINNEG